MDEKKVSRQKAAAMVREIAVNAKEKASSLPHGWYFFIYPDGSFSGPLTGTNYPASEIITTVNSGETLSSILDRIIKQK